MNKSLLAIAIILAFSGAVPDAALAKGKPPPTSEAANNISFPVILSDNVGPILPADVPWRFAPITDPSTCAQETNTTVPVPAATLCYYGRATRVNSETQVLEFIPNPETPAGAYCDGSTNEDCRVWWLQKRAPNFWKTLTVGHDITTPLAVSAVDIGDLLESSPSIATRQIRVEFNLLQHVAWDDPEFGTYVVPDWTALIPEPCAVPTTGGPTSVGCFAALAMSGAVPGTEQSGNEIQGTDFGPGVAVVPAPASGTAIPGQSSRAPGGGGQTGMLDALGEPVPGTQTLLDPATVRLTTPDVGGIQAIVYSRCARLVIQKIGEMPFWDKTTGLWTGTGVGAPVVNVAAYTNAYNAEITSGGSIVYGYNWNAKTASTGTYRLTFVLDGNDDEGPACTGATLGTKFEPPAGAIPGTQLVNVGENNKSGTIIYAGDSQLGDEGGLVYVDLTLTPKGGGGGSGGRP
jgi:hypothetical protein